MPIIVKLPPEPSASSQERKKPAQSKGEQGPGSIQVTPPMIAATLLVVVLILGALFLVRPGGLGGGAATPMMDTGTETLTPGYAEQHANGMDSSTESPGGAGTNNGMDTGTGN